MHLIALKMLVGDRAKYFGLVFGVMFATLLMSQQVSMFIGILERTASQIVDVSEADIWVMSPEMTYIDEIKPMADFELYKIRGTTGVKWAVPFFKGIGRVKTFHGKLQQVVLIGVDNASLIGKPPKMLAGKWEDLKEPNGIILDKAGWDYIWPNKPIELGVEVELNEKIAKIVGICEASPPFMTSPIMYTQFKNTPTYIPQGRKYMSFVVAKSEEGFSAEEVARSIHDKTNLQALTTEEFKWRSINHYLTKTGIPINFGITVGLGFLIGATIVAQTFYIFIIENIKPFAALKAIGVTNKQIFFMVMVQTLVVACIGFGIGIGLATLFFESTSHLNAMRGFQLIYEVVIGTGITILVIMIMASYISIRKVLLVDPATVFRN
ncbi:MAG: ABC transporter permease [Alphaproteobacteria bacterium]|nr:ABC transporter permease [Alphaproteobacteria bacterium]